MRYVLLISAVCVALCAASASAQIWPLPENHYLIWNLEQPIPYGQGPIQFFDQFGDVSVDLSHQEKWGNPIFEKQLGAGPLEPVIWDANVHHLWYKIEPPVQQMRRELLAMHQWGTQFIETFEALYFINPADKNDAIPGWPDWANHYLCYRAVGEPIWGANNLLFALDQWGPWQTFVFEPFCFCNPAEKLAPGGIPYPIQDQNMHLMCYLVNPVPAFIPFSYEDQFGEWSNVAADICLVCLPSLKEYPILPVEESTWGKIKSIFSGE